MRRRDVRPTFVLTVECFRAAQNKGTGDLEAYYKAECNDPLHGSLRPALRTDAENVEYDEDEPTSLRNDRCPPSQQEISGSPSSELVLVLHDGLAK